MGKGERGGGDEGWGWRGGVKDSTKIHQFHPVLQWRDFFRAKNFLLVTIDDSSQLGQSATRMNLYDDSGRSPLAD